MRSDFNAGSCETSATHGDTRVLPYASPSRRLIKLGSSLFDLAPKMVNNAHRCLLRSARRHSISVAGHNVPFGIVRIPGTGL